MELKIELMDIMAALSSDPDQDVQEAAENAEYELY